MNWIYVLLFFLGLNITSEISSAANTPPTLEKQSHALAARCVREASRYETRTSRDKAKLACLNSFAAQMPISQCLNVARGMAYFSNSNKGKVICGSEIPSVTPAKCLQIAREITYSENADELRWNCISRFKGQMSVKQCEDLGKELSLPPAANKAVEFCRL